MESELKINRISKDDFLQLNEEDVMFITNPGRMGDEDGSTFIIIKDNEYICYRVSGWMFGNRSDENYISISDMLKQFPKWQDAWDNGSNPNYDGKYVYINMGFGNGLSVDKSIYEMFKPYLDEEAEFIKRERKLEEVDSACYFNAWKKAANKMINNL